MKDNFSKMRSFMAKHVPAKPSVADLKKEADEAYTENMKNNAHLLELYNQNKLTNKNTIRKARALAQKLNENE